MAMNKSRLFRVRAGPPSISGRAQPWLQLIPITAMVLVAAMCFMWTPTSSEDAFNYATSVDLKMGSFEDVVLGRQLQAVQRECSGTCTSKDVDLQKNTLTSDFLMINGANMLRYADPRDCDEIMIPDNTLFNDDADCIFEMGYAEKDYGATAGIAGGIGRRRVRHIALEYANKAEVTAEEEASYTTQGYTKFADGSVSFTDITFSRDAKTLKCSQGGPGLVTVKKSFDTQISPGALAILKVEKIVWIAFYVIFGIVYMFIALAIVCDEFFVPALECFVDAFGISMDVAGATFMAAGGSMPELFTSFIATFKESEVGFVAIVGSAVFNVLFVIAVCAIASTEVLTLTWWPLARDCFFYIIALTTVAFVFTVSSKNEIEAWEAIILLLEYVGYCSFMKVNGKVFTFVESKLNKKKVAPEDEIRDAAAAADAEENGAKEGGRPGSKDKPETTFAKPSMFRQGIMKLMTQNAYLYETAGMAAVAEIKGELEETFKSLDVDGNGYLTVDEMKKLLEMMGVKSDTTAIKTAMRRINRTNEETITFEAFKRWYLASEARIEAEMSRVFSRFDADGNGFIEADELRECLKSLGHKPTQEEIDELMIELTSSAPEGAGARSPDNSVQVQEIGASPPQPITDEKAETTDKSHVTYEQFEAWYKKSMFYEGKKQQIEEQAEAEESGFMTLDMPEDGGFAATAWWLFTYPLCAIMYCTLPDVRNPKYERNWKMAVVEFGISLVWIGIFSNWLYECLVVVSNTLKIPVAVSAVTLLAGGTSVPDLISSYVVARNGEGDMAVSSSIGSNIFDVTVGLPLPWLCYILLKGKSFALGSSGSKGLGFSILLLIGMLAAVVGTVMAMRWRMTKVLGYCMLVFYVLYVLQYLLQKLPPNCNDALVGVFQVDF